MSSYRKPRDPDAVLGRAWVLGHHHPAYRELVERYRKPLNAPETRERELMEVSPTIGRLLRAERVAARVLGLAVPCTALSLVLAPRVAVIAVAGMAAIVTLKGLMVAARDWKRVRLLGCDSAYADALRLKVRVEAMIAADWDAYCDQFKGRPPDWASRRFRTRLRDGNECVECGWPRGAARLRRTLHVHHVIPLSEGGGNDPDNLVTLCSVCHGKKPGRGHARIRSAAARKRLGKA